VDDKLYQKWSGEVDWSFVKVPVTKGLHTLKWQYSKDEFTGMGDDCAMLDFIVFPLFNEAPQFTSLPVVSATVKEEYTYYIFAKDEKPESLTISCIQKPDWLHFEDMKNGHAVLQGKPPIAATTGIVKLMVNDSISNPVYQTYTIQTTTTSITHINPVHFSIYPVPAQNFIQIEYMLNSEMEVNLELCTITGKRIKNIENHTQQAGCYTQIIDVSGMVSGVYVCKLVFNKVIFTNKIVILH